MKTSKLFAAAAIMLAAVACQVIDEGQAVKSQLKVTATIAEDDESKVDYDVNNTSNTISPKWHTSDPIIGFDDKGQTFTFTVVEGGGKYATFNSDGYTQGDATKLYAIYAPGKKDTDFTGEGPAKTLSINLASQGGVLDGDAPVLMCATAEIVNGQVNFVFENQTAIIGVKKFQLNKSTTSHTVTSMTLNGVVTKGTFSVDGKSDKLTLTPTGSAASITATHPKGGWTTTNEGIFDGGVYFAAMPTNSSTTLSLDATTSDEKNYINVTAIKPTTLNAGQYYYMSKKLGEPEASVTVGGVTTKYMTIGSAWADANTSNDDVTVTLLADCSASDQLTLGSSSGSGKITLDLNGNELTTIPSNHGISVESDRELIVNDASNGTIRNNTDGEYYVIYNTGGTITIKGGTIVSNYRPLRNDESGKVNIEGGTLESTAAAGYAIYNTAELSISGGSIIAKRYPVFNTNDQGQATITGGTIKSTYQSSGGAAVRGYKGTVEISGGYFSMDYSDGELFTVNSGKVYVRRGFFDRPISSTFARTATETTYRNALTNDDTYPYKVESSSSGMCAVIVGSTTYIHSNLQSALSQASKTKSDVTIRLRGKHTPPAGSYDLTNTEGHTITLDLRSYELKTTTASFITTSGKLIITDNSENKGGKITSENNNVITVNGSDADVEISNCVIITSYDGGEENTYNFRTIYHNGGKITITDAEIEATNASAIYSRNGEITINNTIITSKYYGLYGGTSTKVAINGVNTSFYSDAYRCVWANTATTLVTINSGYFYSKGDNNAVTCASVAKANFTFTGGYFSKIGALTGSTGYDKIKDVTGITHTHNDSHKDLSYYKGYVTDEIPGNTEGAVVSLGTAISNGITF